MAKFNIVGEEEMQQPQQAPPQPAGNADTARAVQILALALLTVSQRFVIAVSNLLTAAAVGSAFWLWWRVLPNPDVEQLVGLGLYALFLLAVETVRRRG